MTMVLRIEMLLSVFLLLCFSGFAQQDNVGDMEKLIDEQLNKSVQQYKYFATNIPEGKIPKTIDPKTKELITAPNRWWTNGFYAGTLWYLYEYSHDQEIREEAENQLRLIEPLKTYKGSHDMGFLMFNSFGNAYRITGNKTYRDVALVSAQSLSTRYNDQVKAIKSWDWTPEPFPVIIDNMLNLELLLWAGKETDKESFINEAINHANTTQRNHFRKDYSTWHVVYYDPDTGKAVKKKTHQGYSDSSTWARGEVWALYGYTMMYRETKDKSYLEQADHVADFLFNHPRMPKDLIPYWDFDDPKIPNTYRDVSAAAAMASRLLELAHIHPDSERVASYKQKAEIILKHLSSSDYFYGDKEGVGFLLKHSVGSLPGNNEVDVPLTYADYYYVEALMRYKKWFLED